MRDRNGDEARAALLKETLETAFQAAVNAPDTDVETAIDTGASLMAAVPAGWAEVSRELLVLTGRVVRGCRERGWLPADLVRMARRELGAGHVRLTADLIAAESRGFAAAGPGPRWAGQLRELDAVVWWAGEDAFLEGFGRRARLDRFGVASCVLELLRLLGRLPRITPLGPPGTRPEGKGPGRGGGHKMLGRIRALLAKAESTAFPEEAEALSAKAQHLMAWHSLDEALLAGGVAAGDGPTACRIGIDHPYEAAKALLLDAVAAANRCQAVWSGEFGFSTVVGYESDLEGVELLYTSLLVQADTAVHRGGSRSKNFRQSFLIAYAGRIRERLAAATEQAADETGTPEERLLPVLAAREVAVNDTTERMFPTTTSHRLKGRDREGWEHGTAAADRAAL